jgi:CheY-like chemotaxis protein
MKGDEERSRAAGCCEYIAKPVRALDLANRLRTFLDQLGLKSGRESLLSH